MKGAVIEKNTSGEIIIKSNGTRMSMPADMLWAFESGEYYEKNVGYFLDKLFDKYQQPVFIDIGANYGYYTVKYASKCKTVVCFEPVSKTFEVLSDNIKSNNLLNVIAHNLGLSDVRQDMAINLYSSSGNNSIFERNIPEGHALKKTGVEMIQLYVLDEILQAGDGIVPDIIKIDVEGAEVQVLRGAAETISKYRPAILVEYSESTSYDAGYNKEDILKQFKIPGYTIYGIPENPDDFRLIEEIDLAKEQISNLVILPAEISFLK